MLCRRCSTLLRGSRVLAVPTRSTGQNVASPTIMRRYASSTSIASSTPQSAFRRSTAPRTSPTYQFYSSAASPGATTSTTEPEAKSSVVEKPDFLDEAESTIWDRLTKEFNPVELVVQDISGGCGSMYGIDISSKKFRGANMLKQQRMVNTVLGDLMKGWHGVQLKTRVP
ncbi:hypothetical protein VMCG_06623 [Cytospora schulzeri]|uniref:Bola-like protein n=1 Tax=Cytospora schulzeri TaxID=448051 RepID=A0A423W6Z7_9PEZI|nr:hypothetical protein VMCG_06623 [Valsa malicola]